MYFVAFCAVIGAFVNGHCDVTHVSMAVAEGQGSVSPAVSFSDIRGHGCGVLASQYIPAHSVVMVIPLSLAVNSFTVQHGQLSKVFDCINYKPSLTDLTAWSILTDYDLWDVELQGRSWVTDMTLIELQGLPIAHILSKRLENALTSYRNLRIKLDSVLEDGFVVKRSRSCGLEFSELDSIITKLSSIPSALFIKALGLIWSRNFSVSYKGTGKDIFRLNSLVPLADMFNAGFGDQTNVLCYTNSEGTAFVCRNTKNIEPNQQLLVDYGDGAGDNNQLFLSYGFIRSDNPSPVVWIEVPPSEDNLSPIEGFVVVNEPNKLILEVHLDSWVNSLLRYFHISTRMNGKRIYKSVIDHLERVLAQFPTNISEDFEILKIEPYNYVVRYRLEAKRHLLQILDDAKQLWDHDEL